MLSALHCIDLVLLLIEQGSNTIICLKRVFIQTTVNRYVVGNIPHLCLEGS